jgi:UDP-3-O-[3-hydroxymyristoyl] glucosamine N-acyltransferase
LRSRRFFRVDELAKQVGGSLIGDGSVEVSGVASLADAGPKDLSFFASDKYAEALAKTRAGALLTTKRVPTLEIPQIVLPDPFLAINRLIDFFHPPDGGKPPAGIDSQAKVAVSAQIGEGASIGPFVFVGEGASIGARTVVHSGAYIGADVRLGDDTVIWPNVVIREGSVIGSRVTIHSGAVVGADGFGFARRNGSFVKLRHVGIVFIEDDVEIGANATIDRANFGRTLIRRGVRLDNLVHIGHNVEIGEDTAMAAQCGVSGSTIIGKRVMMGGQVGAVDHLRIGDDSILIAQSGVIGDVPPRAKVSGYPARPHREVLRAQAEMRGLARLKARLRAIEEKLSRLLS